MHRACGNDDSRTYRHHDFPSMPGDAALCKTIRHLSPQCQTSGDGSCLKSITERQNDVEECQGGAKKCARNEPIAAAQQPPSIHVIAQHDDVLACLYTYRGEPC